MQRQSLLTRRLIVMMSPEYVAVHPRAYLSAFTGIGALDLGVKRVFRDARAVCYVENDLSSASRVVEHIQDNRLDAAPLWSDVATFPTGLFRGYTDMVIGGFPCTDLSAAGRQAGIHGARSGLFFELCRLYTETEARYLFMENVDDITGNGLDIVLAELA